MLERRPDWPQALDRYIRERDPLPFRWAHNDCVTFAAGGVEAVTGFQLLKVMGARWHDEESARALLAGISLLKEAEDFFKTLDAAQIPRAFARRGDVGLAVTDRGETMTLRATNHWLGPGLRHMLAIPDEQVIRAWAIGWRP